MARISMAPEGGKFRARAAASIDAEPGTWGNGDLLCVTIDANGELVLSDGTDCDGVIFVPESRRESAVSLDNFQQVIGGKVYTVFTWAEIQGLEVGDDPTFAAGDRVFGDAAGAVSIGTGTPTPAGAVYLGVILVDDTVPGGAGLRMVLDLGAAAVATGA